MSSCCHPWALCPQNAGLVCSILTCEAVPGKMVESAGGGNSHHKRKPTPAAENGFLMKHVHDTLLESSGFTGLYNSIHNNVKAFPSSHVGNTFADITRSGVLDIHFSNVAFLLQVSCWMEAQETGCRLGDRG